MSAPGRDASEIALLRAGDELAFERLVERTRGALWRVALGVSPGRAQAQDLIQECYMKAYASLLGGTWDGENERAWLRVVLVRLAMGAARSRRRRRKALALFGLEPRVPRVDRAETGLPARLREALESLAPAQRAAIVLQAMDGATQEEIARALGRSEGAVEQLLVRARRALRERLERDDDGGRG